MRRGRLGTVLLMAVIGFSAGCGIQVGMFKHENRGKLALSALTRDEALLLFGPPLRDRTITNDEGVFDQFYYGTSDGAAVRTMFLEFRSDRLNAHIFISTFPGESIDFDVNTSKKIINNAHSKGDVLKILSNPSGKALCPSALGGYEHLCERGKEIWEWVAFSRRNAEGSAVRTKEITVLFDGNGVVVDVKSKVESSREN